MVDDLTIDHLADLEESYELFKAYTGIAERAVDYIKMSENGVKPLPDAIKQSEGTDREFVSQSLDAARDALESALDTFSKNTVLKEHENRYDSLKPLSEYIHDLDFMSTGTYTDTGLLLGEIEVYKSIVDYADRNDVDLDSEHFEFYNDGTIIDGDSEDDMLIP